MGARAPPGVLLPALLPPGGAAAGRPGLPVAYYYLLRWLPALLRCWLLSVTSGARATPRALSLLLLLPVAGPWVPAPRPAPAPHARFFRRRNIKIVPL